MSTTKVAPSTHAGTSLDYAFYGDSGEQKQAHLEAGTSRVAAFRSSMGNEPTEGLRAALQQDAEAHGRKNQMYVYKLNFHPDEFDVTKPEDLERVADVGEKLARSMHSADYAVVVHADAAGGHAHAHIYVNNHDNLTGKSLQKYTSWSRGLHQLNDDLMEREGLRRLPDPARQKEDWTLRREEFSAGGFERTLGDKIAAGLRDPRSTDAEAFTEVLREHDVSVTVAKSGEFRYKMRHPTTGKIQSKSGAKLTPEFTAAGTREIFDYHAARHQQRQEHGHGDLGRDAAAGQTGRELGAVAAVDVTAGRFGRSRHGADRGDQRAEPAADRDSQEHQRSADVGGEDAAADSAQRHIRIRARAEAVRRDREDARDAQRDAVRRTLDRGNRPARSQSEGLGYSR
ncbi:relaxase/mobilization nuclease domain-containing protein [Corynebacteriaceae bacterium 7-707]